MAAMEEKLFAWAILGFGWLLPLVHVTLSPRGGSWTPPPGGGCSLGPRVGSHVLVLLLGPVGCLLFSRRRDWTSVVWRMSVEARLDWGGHRYIKNKKTNKN